MARRGDEVLLDARRARPPRRRARRDRRAPRGPGRPSSHERPLPLLDPEPAGRFKVVSAMPPEHYEAAVARARRAHPRRGVRQDRARARGAGPRARRRTTRRRCSASCARRSRRATSSAPPAATARSSPPARSCSCAAKGCAPGRSRSPARRGAAPTRPSTTTSASSCCAPTRTARSRRSSAAASCARCGPHSVWVDRGRGAGRREDGEHPAPRDADPRAARPAGERGRARRAAAPDAGRRRRADRRRRAADPRARGPRPRLVRGPGRVDRPRRGRRVLRRAALRAADAGRSRAATRASASCATRTRRPSWPRPRSSCRRCCRCSPADGDAGREPGARGPARGGSDPLDEDRLALRRAWRIGAISWYSGEA